MKRTGVLLVAAIAASGAFNALAQNSDGDSDWTLDRLPWGDPDLTGVFSSDDMRGVPLQRPEEFGERLFMTDEEFAADVGPAYAAATGRQPALHVCRAVAGVGLA